MTDDSAHSSSDPMVGKTIKHYRILSKLGQGGMGVVYKAEDTTLGRTVALKFLPKSFHAMDDAEARFVQEAKAASALDHPNIGTVHEIGRTEGGDLYIAMAFYAGETLEHKIEKGPLPVELALDYAIQVARGLERAHEGGIIHRDIKPGNVIVTERGLAKVVDFGLAKVEDVTITRGTVSLGTVAYMSPEQAMGGDLDRRTDLWALGVVLYEMLAGRRPFAGPYEAAVLYAAANQPHDPVTMYRPEVNEVVSAVIDGLLAKEPAQRYSSAADVVLALEAARIGVAEPGATVSRIMPRGETISRMAPAPAPVATTGGAARPAWLVPVVGLVGVVVVAAIGWFLLGPGAGAGSVSDEDRAQARAQHDEALENLQAGRFSVAQAKLERALQLDPGYSAAYATLSGLHIRLRDYLAAADAATKAVSLDSTNSVAHYNRGYALQETGDPEAAALAYRAAIRSDKNLINAYSALADVLIELGRPAEAVTVLDEGRRINPGSDLLFLLDKNRGKAELALGNPAQALGYLGASLQARPDWPETVALLAQAQFAIGDAASADRTWTRYFEVETDAVRRAEMEAVRGRMQ